MQASRSVTAPTTRRRSAPSTTGTNPQSRSHISCAARLIVSSGRQVTTSFVRPSQPASVVPPRWQRCARKQAITRLPTRLAAMKQEMWLWPVCLEGTLSCSPPVRRRRALRRGSTRLRAAGRRSTGSKNDAEFAGSTRRARGGRRCSRRRGRPAHRVAMHSGVERRHKAISARSCASPPGSRRP